MRNSARCSASIRDQVQAEIRETRLPTIEDGEGWFEAANWMLAARAARDRYVMATLGACYGAQAVGSCRALQFFNPMPYKLVAVEPEPENYEWTRRHMRDNGIDPDDQWLVKSAISKRNDPVLFPIGSPGSGAQNCVATNESFSRKIYAEEIIARARRRGAAQPDDNKQHRPHQKFRPGRNFLPRSRW